MNAKRVGTGVWHGVTRPERSGQRWRLMGLTLIGYLLVGLGVGALPGYATPGLCAADLGQQVEAIVNRDPWQRSRWGILVQAVETGETLYARSAQQYFIPASNAKLLTTAAALTDLGSDFRIRTSVYQVPSTTDGTVLRLVGRGDPSVTEVELGQLAAQVYTALRTTPPLSPETSQNFTIPVGSASRPHIEQLLIDDRYFQGDPINPNWEWEDLQAGYGAPATSLILNRNQIGLQLIPQQLGQPLRVEWEDPTEARHWQIENQSRTVAAGMPEFTQVGRDLSRPILRVAGQLTVGGDADDNAIAVLNPSQQFADRFRRALERLGVTVDQVVLARGEVAPTELEVAAIASPPLAELVHEANSESENIYAEAMLRILGVRHPTPSASSLEAGLAAVEAVLTPLGVDPEAYALVDGSGLSRKNLASPLALVQTLRAIAHTPQAQPFRNSLAVAGRSGTLKNRFRDTPVQDHLWGKTGAISGIAVLSGYLEPRHHAPLTFSIIVNHFDVPVRSVRPVIDELVLLLASLEDC